MASIIARKEPDHVFLKGSGTKYVINVDICCEFRSIKDALVHFAGISLNKLPVLGLYILVPFNQVEELSMLLHEVISL
jgi:hypothetical protein